MSRFNLGITGQALKGNNCCIETQQTEVSQWQLILLLLSSSELLNGTGASWQVRGMLVICCNSIFFPFLFLMLYYLEGRSEEVSKLSARSRVIVDHLFLGRRWHPWGGWCWATGHWVVPHRWGTDILVRDTCGLVWGRKHSLMLLTAHNCFLLIIPTHRNFFNTDFCCWWFFHSVIIFFSIPSFNCRSCF